MAKWVVVNGWFKHKAHSAAQHSEDAEDILQNVAEKLLKKNSLCNQSYVGKSVASTAIDLHRAQQRRSYYESVYAQQLFDLASQSPERQAQIGQASEAFEKALHDLSPMCQDIMLRYYVDGESQKCIAASLRVHLSTVEKQLSKGRKHCFKRVKPYI